MDDGAPGWNRIRDPQLGRPFSNTVTEWKDSFLTCLEQGKNGRGCVLHWIMLDLATGSSIGRKLESIGNTRSWMVRHELDQ